MRIGLARVFLALLTAALAASCAGGGGGGGGAGIAVSPPVSPPPPPLPPPPPPPPSGIPSVTSSEYLRGYAVADTKAITAWQNGATGQGVLVALIDDGIDATHPELTGRVSPASIDINGARNQIFSTSDTHGSELAAIVAGNFNNSSTVGLAYNSTILAVRADNGAESFGAADLANSVDYAIAQGAKVINFSLGGSNPSAQVFRDAIQRATSAGIIVVVSAGNDGPNAPEVNYPGFLATSPTVSNNLIMVAGAHNSSGALVSFSNRAGLAQNFFITAPGSGIIVPDFANPGPTDPAFQVCFADLTCQVQGTSYSAPYLTGAVALVRGAFPGLTPQQVVQLILNAADDFGDPGVDAISGHGRLNIARAFQPVGPVAAPLAFGQENLPVSTPIGVAGAAFGDGLVNNPGVWTTVGFDDLGRTFSVNLARNWSAAGRASSGVDAPAVWREMETQGGRVSFAAESVALPDSLRAMFDVRDVARARFRAENALSKDTLVSFAANAPALSSLSGLEARGHMAFVGADVSAAVTHSLGNGREVAFTVQSGGGELGLGLGRSNRRGFAARVRQVVGPFSTAATLGALREGGAQLGLAWSERIDGVRPDSNTRFLALEELWKAGDYLTLSAEAEIGRSSSVGGGWLTVAKPLTTSAFAIGATFDATPDWVEQLGAGARGRFAFTIRQPLRVEGGALSVSLPTADAYGRTSLRYVSRAFDPAPSGRELDLTASYDLFVTGRLSAHIELSEVIEPGHVRAADPESLGRVGVRLNY